MNKSSQVVRHLVLSFSRSFAVSNVLWYLALAAPVVSRVGTAEAQLSKPVENWPQSPKLDPKDPLAKNEKSASYITFGERAFEWPPVFAQDKKFELLASLPDVQGYFALISGVADRTQTPPQRFNLIALEKLSKIQQPYLSTKDATVKEATYKVSTPTYIHTPQFSNDHDFLLARVGSPPVDRFQTIGLFLWNLRESTFHFVDAAGQEPFIYFPVIQWSPGSRYLSYLKDGNSFGDYDEWTKAYRLYICDLRTYQEREIAVNVGQHWSWTYRGTVLFSQFDAAGATAVAERKTRPWVYESEANGLPRPLFGGGYFAQESPDGQWIAFCDWPGKLLEEREVSEEVKNNAQRGLFLFQRSTGKRTFVGPLRLEPGNSPSLQWSPDSKNLFVLEPGGDTGALLGSIYKMEIGQQKLQKLSEPTIPRLGAAKTANKAGFFEVRGMSPNGKYIYLDIIQVIDGPPGYINTSRVLIAVDAVSGIQTSLARLINNGNANSSWDWYDDGSINSSFVSAKRVEDTLPVFDAPKL